MLQSAFCYISNTGNNIQAVTVGKPIKKNTGEKRRGVWFKFLKSILDGKLSQRESERRSRMEAMDLRKCNKFREMKFHRK